MPNRTRTVEIKLEENIMSSRWDIVLDSGEHRALVYGLGTFHSEFHALDMLAAVLGRIIREQRKLDAERRENGGFGEDL